MEMLQERVHEIYRALTLSLIDKGLTISTMESCTSGLVASLISDTEGASAVLRGGAVTYCNAAKIAAGVPARIIETCGVYSEQTAEAMAAAARRLFDTDIGIGVTGTFANADPANADSVPGMVWLATDIKGDVRCIRVELGSVYPIQACGHGEPVLLTDESQAYDTSAAGIPVRMPERFICKLLTAERIAQELGERLTQWV